MKLIVILLSFFIAHLAAAMDDAKFADECKEKLNVAVSRFENTPDRSDAYIRYLHFAQDRKSLVAPVAQKYISTTTTTNITKPSEELLEGEFTAAVESGLDAGCIFNFIADDEHKLGYYKSVAADAGAMPDVIIGLHKFDVAGVNYKNPDLQKLIPR